MRHRKFTDPDPPSRGRHPGVPRFAGPNGRVPAQAPRRPVVVHHLARRFRRFDGNANTTSTSLRPNGKPPTTKAALTTTGSSRRPLLGLLRAVWMAVEHLLGFRTTHLEWVELGYGTFLLVGTPLVWAFLWRERRQTPDLPPLRLTQALAAGLLAGFASGPNSRGQPNKTTGSTLNS